MVEYAGKFDDLMHSLLAHHSSWNAEFFITHFVDGLRGDIRAAVVLHRPVDLDTAVSLACLQEEVTEVLRPENKRSESSGPSRGGGKPAWPLPLPLATARLSVGVPAGRVDDRRGTEAARAAGSDDKLAALWVYRRAKGICHK